MPTRDPVKRRLQKAKQKARWEARYPEKVKAKRRRAYLRRRERLKDTAWVREDKMAVIYVIRCQEFTKIGIAQNLKSRLQTFTTHCPFQLQVVWASHFMPYRKAREIEQICHTRLLATHHQGEWFGASPEQAIAVLSQLLETPFVEPDRQLRLVS